MIGDDRVRQSVAAQLGARGLDNMYPEAVPPKAMTYYASAAHKDAALSAGGWARKSTELIFSATKKSGNHVCRPDVCHKGRIGKQGFCRMFFWHWCRYRTAKRNWQRAGATACHCRRAGMERVRRPSVSCHLTKVYQPWRSHIPST